MGKRQTVNLLSSDRVHIIRARLDAFDREAADSGESEEVVSKLRKEYEEDLRHAPTVTPSPDQMAPSDFQQYLGRHRVREYAKQEGRALEYPNSDL